MPKSKKARKKYDPTRWSSRPRMMSLKDQKEISDAYRAVELAVELRLHTGQFTKDDLLNLESFMILATFILYRGYGVDGEFCIEKYGDDWVAMQNAFWAYRDHAKDTESFTCKAEWLNAIRDGVQIAGEVIQAALDADPVRVAELFLLTEDLTDFPKDFKDEIKWMDRKLKEIKRWRKPC